MTETQPNHTTPKSTPAETILVAVDFSTDSEAALVWACHYAKLVGAGVLVLHVIHDPSEAPGYYKKGRKDDTLRPMEDLAKEELAEFLDSVRSKYVEVAECSSLKTVLVKGIPPSRILEAAKSTDASLIVMGSRGLTGLPHLMLGSKAERVVQLSSIPVTIVKSESSEDEE